jgi:hypothetical protein
LIGSAQEVNVTQSLKSSSDPGTYVAPRGTPFGSAYAAPAATRTIIATSGSSVSPITLGAGAANDTRLVGLMIGSTMAGQIAIDGWTIKNTTGGSSAAQLVIAAAGIGYISAPGCLNDAGALKVTLGATADHGKVAADWYPA